MNLTAIRSYREVGEILGIADTTVYYLEQKALKKLRKRLAHHAPEIATQAKREDV